MAGVFLQAVLGGFDGVLSAETGIFLAGLEALHGVGGDLTAGLAIFFRKIPVMRLFFHFLLLFGDSLRFEPKPTLTAFGSESEQGVEAFVEGSRVGWFGNGHKGRSFFVGDGSGVGVNKRRLAGWTRVTNQSD